MPDWLLFPLLLIGYIVLQTWILPKMGVST